MQEVEVEQVYQLEVQVDLVVVVMEDKVFLIHLE
jgi:hypothetical protein